MRRILALISLFAICTVHFVYGDLYILDEVVGIDEGGTVERLTIEQSHVVLSKDKIFHHDTLDVFVVTEKQLDPDQLTMRVYHEKKVCPLLGMILDIPFLLEKNDSGINVYKAVYLPNWNAEEGNYEISISYGKTPIVTREKLEFVLLRRLPRTMKSGFSVVDLEMNKSIKTKSFRGPYGETMDYSAICEWARFMDADALWILSGETTTFKKRKTSSPWDPEPLENLYLLKEIAGVHDIDIGAYIMSFYVPGGSGVTEGYDAAIGYNSDKNSLYSSRYISLSCEKRISDIIELARGFQQDPDIDYIGFDFIRTGEADGYELASTVIEETNIKTPPEWESMSSRDKIVWFAKKIEVEKDPLIIEKWRWWRAHEVAKIIERVIEEAGITKPVWIYTLGWDHGREHGQDPVMFFDAGVTIDAVMLYESSRYQFIRMLDQWRNYIREGQGNIIVGNCVDERLLDSEFYDPPQEFYRRNVLGYSSIIKDGIASGIFFHDMARAFWGKRGGYTAMDYAISHMSSIYNLKKDRGEVDLIVDVDTQMAEGDNAVEGYLLLKNNSTDSLNNIEIKCLYPYDDAVWHDSDDHNRLFIAELSRFETMRMEFTVRSKKNPINKGYLRFWIEIEGKKRYFITVALLHQ